MELPDRQVLDSKIKVEPYSTYQFAYQYKYFFQHILNQDEKKQAYFTPIAFPFKDVCDVENAMDLKKESSFISGAVLPIFSKLSQKKSVHSR